MAVTVKEAVDVYDKSQQERNHNHQASLAKITTQLVVLTSSTQQQAAAATSLQKQLDASVSALVAKDKADKGIRKKIEKKQETKETNRRANAFEKSLHGKMDTMLNTFSIQQTLATMKTQMEENNARHKEDANVRLQLQATIAKQELDALRLLSAAEIKSARDSQEQATIAKKELDTLRQLSTAARKQNGGGHDTYSRWLLLLTQCPVDPNCITQERAVAIHT